MTDNNLLEAERTARCKLLAARDEERDSNHLENAIFEAYLVASKATSQARHRESAAFDAWYAASKELAQIAEHQKLRLASKELAQQTAERRHGP